MLSGNMSGGNMSRGNVRLPKPDSCISILNFGGPDRNAWRTGLWHMGHMLDTPALSINTLKQFPFLVQVTVLTVTVIDYNNSQHNSRSASMRVAAIISSVTRKITTKNFISINTTQRRNNGLIASLQAKYCYNSVFNRHSTEREG